jgi:hypothetical protein
MICALDTIIHVIFTEPKLVKFGGAPKNWKKKKKTRISRHMNTNGSRFYNNAYMTKIVVGMLIHEPANMSMSRRT